MCGSCSLRGSVQAPFGSVPVSVPLVELVEVRVAAAAGRRRRGGARKGGRVSLYRQLGYETLRMRDARCGACQEA